MSNQDQAPSEESTDDDASGESNAREIGADEAFCTSCGEPIKKEAEICPECGVRQGGSSAQVAAPQQKNPGLAAVASFFFAGLGQIYNGQIAKGILLMVVQVINVGLMFVVVGLFTYPIVWVYGMWDAYKTAEKINNGEVSV